MRHLLLALVPGLLTAAPRADLGAGKLFPGSALAVRFRPTPSSLSATASGFQQKAAFYLADLKPEEPLEYAILAVPLDTKPGTHAVTVSWTEEGRAQSERLSFKVARRPGKAVQVRLPKKASKAMKALEEEKPQLEAAFASAQGPPLWRGRFREPVPIGRITGPFALERRYVPGARRWKHKGVDLAVPTGTPVVAANDGLVLLAKEGTLAYGGLVVLSHGYELCSSYLHLSRVLVKPGQALAKGELLGLSGEEGIANGPHLHWQMNLRGFAIDPMAWMDKEALAVLK